MTVNQEKLAYLRVKVKSLASEAAIIRLDEGRHREASKRQSDPNRPDTVAAFEDRRAAHRATWLGLKSHRRQDLRHASRSAQLAYGFLRGVPYRAMEAKCHLEPDWDKVAKNVAKFGDFRDARVASKAVGAWAEAEATTARSTVVHAA